MPRDHSGPPRFIHADLTPANIIVSPSTGRLSGIIDWAAALGDPAEDFAYLVLCRGPSFLRRVLDTYELPVDAELIDRAIFHGRVRALGWLVDAIKRGGATPVLEAVRGAFAE